MPEYKRQHYLPAVYLKNFSVDGPRATRKSHVWRIDLRNSLSVSVESQCAGDYLFSRQSPKATEEMFQELEDAYQAAVRKIWDGKDPTSFEYFALIVCMFELYTRNIAHGNPVGLEGVDVYQRRNATLMARLIMRLTQDDIPTNHDMLAHLKEFWRVQLLRSPGGEILTSDHPCVVGNWDRSESVQFALMPITSDVYGVAYNRRFSISSGQVLTEGDGCFLALSQIEQCNEAVYCATAPAPEFVEQIRAEMKQRPVASEASNGEKWDLNFKVPPRPDALSFLRPCRPNDLGM